MADPNHLAARLRAHARLFRQIAEQAWREDRAQELVRRADECTRMADAISAGPEGPSRVPQPRTQ